jgi:hypothetical protein
MSCGKQGRVKCWQRWKRKGLIRSPVEILSGRLPKAILAAIAEETPADKLFPAIVDRVPGITAAEIVQGGKLAIKLVELKMLEFYEQA